MVIGYVRVSKADGSQTLDLQRDALLSSGVTPKHIYEDQASGQLSERPGLEACLKALRKKDVLVLWKLDRLGRDLRHLVNTVHYCANGRTMDYSSRISETRFRRRLQGSLAHNQVS